MASPSKPPAKSKSDLMMITPREKSLLRSSLSKENLDQNQNLTYGSVSTPRKHMPLEELIKFTIRQRLHLHELMGTNKV
jgi:hypothetical protein